MGKARRSRTPPQAERGKRERARWTCSPVYGALGLWTLLSVIASFGCEDRQPAAVTYAPTAPAPAKTSAPPSPMPSPSAGTMDAIRAELEATDHALADGCMKGDQKTCVSWGERLRRKAKATSVELEHAMTLFQNACDRKVADGCAGLGSMYQEGAFVTRNLPRAVLLFRSACEAKSARACSRLGALYARGEGVERDTQRALAYSEQGCTGGDGLGCVNLGLMYQHADGVPADTKHAFELYTKACGLVDGRGCRLLGALYAQGGAGQDANPTLAVMFSERACRLGDATGCGNAGMNAQLGFGTAQDPPRAARLYQAACDLGEARFCELVKRIDAQTAANKPN